MYHDQQTMSRMSFDLMCNIEPALQHLVEQAEKHRHLSFIERERYWYRDLKKQMSFLVGWYARKVEKSSPDLTAREFNRSE